MNTLACLALTSLALVVPNLAKAFYVEARPLEDGGADAVLRYDTSTPVEYRIAMAGVPGTGGDGSDVSAIQAAFATWSGRTCSTLTFTEGARVAMPDPRHWQTDPARYILVYASDDEAIWGASVSVGRFDFVEDGAGNMIGATIVLNTRDHAFSTSATPDPAKLDLQSVMTALVGRSLGISSTMEGNATFPRYAPGDASKRTLGTDDENALRFLYTNGMAGCEATVTPEMICGETTPDCPPPVSTTTGDGGMGTARDGGTGGSDAGVMMPSDASVSMGDGGATTTTDDDGCDCRVAGRRSSPNALSLGVLGALLAFAIRRRTGRPSRRV